MIDLNICFLPSGKIINFPQNCPIISVGEVYKITERNIDLQNVEFTNGTIGNYYFPVNYINGICLPCIYSSARKANTDRNFIIKWLKDYVNLL